MDLPLRATQGVQAGGSAGATSGHRIRFWLMIDQTWLDALKIRSDGHPSTSQAHRSERIEIRKPGEPKSDNVRHPSFSCGAACKRVLQEMEEPVKCFFFLQPEKISLIEEKKSSANNKYYQYHLYN